MNNEIEATAVIEALRAQLSDAHYQLAIMTARLAKAEQQLGEGSEA